MTDTVRETTFSDCAHSWRKGDKEQMSIPHATLASMREENLLQSLLSSLYLYIIALSSTSPKQRHRITMTGSGKIMTCPLELNMLLLKQTNKLRMGKNKDWSVYCNRNDAAIWGSDGRAGLTFFEGPPVSSTKL